MKNIIMAAGVALLMVGCGESEPSGKYQCEIKDENVSFLIDSKNKTWDMVSDKGSMVEEVNKRDPEANVTTTLTHNKDTEIYALNVSGVKNKKAESKDLGTFKYDSDNDTLNFVSLFEKQEVLPSSCKKID